MKTLRKTEIISSSLFFIINLFYLKVIYKIPIIIYYLGKLLHN